jgi:predicted regulator of Ras-like GTPase activity (Roadblock/LC7/MglB family)
MASLNENWPEEIRREVADSHLEQALLRIPLNRIEPGMRMGRVTTTWNDVRGWINSPAAEKSSPYGETPVELSLKVIAPLYMNTMRPSAPRRKVTIGENVPDVFCGSKTSSVQAPPVGSAASLPGAAPTPVSQPPVSPENEWSPPGIAQKLCAMPGVAGCLLTTSDGLLVASQVPSNFKTETIAAFLPQIFARLNHYSGEMGLGVLSTVNFTAGTIPCSIAKAGRLYVSLLGRTREALPEGALQQIASELAKRNP